MRIIANTFYQEKGWCFIVRWAIKSTEEAKSLKEVFLFSKTTSAAPIFYYVLVLSIARLQDNKNQTVVEDNKDLFSQVLSLPRDRKVLVSLKKSIHFSLPGRCLQTSYWCNLSKYWGYLPFNCSPLAQSGHLEVQWFLRTHQSCYFYEELWEKLLLMWVLSLPASSFYKASHKFLRLALLLL